METPAPNSAKLQWKWVAITFAMYIVFYLLPITAASGKFAWLQAGAMSDRFLGIWIFGGIIVVAGVAAFLSKGITIWEPAIAGGALAEFILGYGAIRIIYSTASQRFSLFQILVPMVMITAVVFLLSVFGAWLGEWAQQLWRSHPSSEEDTSETNTGKSSADQGK